MYPQAPVYTSIYWPKALPEAYRSWDVRPSLLNRLPFIKQRHQLFLPLYPLGFESLDLGGYDVVLSVTSAFAHGVRTPPRARHVCYCLTPARFLWNYPSYIEREGVGRMARLALPPLVKRLRRWDRAAANRVDQFIAISRTVQGRIVEYYQRDSRIIYPPVRTDRFGEPRQPEDYFLVVSRLIPYKRIDLAVRAFNQLGLPLTIVGDGRDRTALEALAKSNVQFLGYLPDEAVREQMAHCRALLLPGEEDFCLTPVETMAAGRPAIAYGIGGALDTIVEGQTGLFFHEPTPEALIEAVRRMEEYSFDPATLQRHARRFGVARFKRELGQALERAEAVERG